MIPKNPPTLLLHWTLEALEYELVIEKFLKAELDEKVPSTPPQLIEPPNESETLTSGLTKILSKLVARPEPANPPSDIAPVELDATFPLKVPELVTLFPPNEADEATPKTPPTVLFPLTIICDGFEGYP